MRRRGPDSSKEWRSKDGRVELLHARLAIVDTDGRSHQPFADPARGVTVAFTGEIYNYQNLRDGLKGYDFRTDSDTEVLLATYTMKGIAGVNDLRGMLAACIVDETRGRLILLRDPVGKKPLFVARWGADVLFGSSLLPLVRAHGVDCRLDDAAAESYWRDGFIHPDATVLQGAKPVLPGECIQLDWRGAEISRQRWEPSPAALYQGETVVEVERKVAALLENSVRLRLNNNPSPTVLLSGGVDSTVITALAATAGPGNNPPKDFKALSLASVIPFTNDEPYARHAARRLGLRVRWVRPSLHRLGETVIQALDLQDEPLGGISFFLLERLVRAASEHSRILLTGDGGDEVFLGYGRPADWKSEGASSGGNRVPCGPSLPTWFSAWARRTVTDGLVGAMFTKVDRASAEQGVEIRSPLLDWDLMCYARSLPFEMLTHGGQAKALLKAQLGGWPEWFVNRPKVGFAYNLRWLWGMRRFAGLREHLDPRAVDTFARHLPSVIRGNPMKWKTADVFRHFESAWRLLAWSRFLHRMRQALQLPV